MHRILLPLLLLLSFAVIVQAQDKDVDFREELRFADALRSRGDNALALEVIEKLARDAPKELAKELSLEKAKIRLRIAGEARDTNRRLRLYREAGLEFQKFIDDNPGHARIAEANLDVARVLNLTGRTELNQALLADSMARRKELATQARATLVQAAAKLAAAAKALEEEKAKLPKPEDVADARKKKEAEAQFAALEREWKETQIERGLNLYDQAETHLGAINVQVANLFEEAKKTLAPISSGPATDPATWKARAWSGRVAMRLASKDDARRDFIAIIDNAKSETPVNTEGIRLAKYFRMLLFREDPPDVYKAPGALNKHLMGVGEAWRLRYAKHLLTPEGAGVTFLLAQVYLDEAGREKGPDKLTADRYRASARRLLTELERSENEFTDRARRLKFQIIRQQGVLDRPIDKLDNFEDCYVRAQYETYQMSLDPIEEIQKQLKEIDLEKIKDAKEKKAAQDRISRLEAEEKKLREKDGLENWRKAHVDNLMQALNRALEMNAKATRDRRRPGDVELDTARALLAYWSLNSQKYKEAIEHGEAFAYGASSESSSQASECAIYALQGYVALLGNSPDSDAVVELRKKLKALDPARITDAREKKEAEAKVNDLKAEIAKLKEKDDESLRVRFLKLCQFMERTWPGDLAGDLAAHNLALQMLQRGNVREAIKKLSLMPPSSANYVHTRVLLAELATKADKDNLEPLEGDRPGDYRKRALMALASMPDNSIGTDWLTNFRYVNGKIQLAAGVYPYGRFVQMDEIATKVLAQIDARPDAPFHEEKDKDAQMRDDLKFRLTSLKLYARQGQADDAMAAKDFVRVAQLLDPVIDVVSKKDGALETAILKDQQQLAGRMLQTALQANLQQGKIDRTEAVLEAMNKVNTDEKATSSTAILRVMAVMIRGQVEEMRRKGDKAGLATAIKGYTAILDRQIAKHKGEMKSDFLRVLADCYSSMGEHAKAADRLEKIPDPKAKPKSQEEAIWKGVQISLVRELRLSGTKDNLKKARDRMDEMRGPDNQKPPGWGRQNIVALMEHAKLLQAEEKWGEAFTNWKPILTYLAKQVGSGGEQVKELYLDSVYNACLSGVRLSQANAVKEERDKGLDAVAVQLVTFEGNWEDFGGETWKKLFVELIESDPVLKEKYQARKAKKKN